MNAVVVGHIHCGKNLRAVKVNVIAAADPVAPSCGLIAHGHVLYQHVFAADHHDYPRGREACVARIKRMRVRAYHGRCLRKRGAALGQGARLAHKGHQGALRLLLFGHWIHICPSLAINGTATRNGNVLAIFRVNKAALIETRGVFRVPKIGHNVGEVICVGGAEQYGISFNAQLYAASQINSAAQKASSFQRNAPASLGGAGIYGGLDGRRIQVYTVSDGSVFFYITVQHTVAPFGVCVYRSTHAGKSQEPARSLAFLGVRCYNQAIRRLSSSPHFGFWEVEYSFARYLFHVGEI